jgi:hypothetical protein
MLVRGVIRDILEAGVREYIVNVKADWIAIGLSVRYAVVIKLSALGDA